MKLSELYKVKVTITETKHHPSYNVRCDVCGHEWNLLLNQKGKIRRGEWKCQMCHPPKSWLEDWEEIKKEEK